MEQIHLIDTSNTMRPSKKQRTEVNFQANTTPSCPSESINQYTGYKIVQKNEALESISSNIPPKQFFKEFVKTRRPCIIKGGLTDNNWKGSEWNNAHLDAVAGASDVRLERRRAEGDEGSESGGDFGYSTYDVVKFHDFLLGLEGGSGSHYLTTQDLGVDEEGRPDIMSTPCTELRERGGFPLVPEIMGNLIPMNYNVWMGTNPRGKGSSSRLHHDFHDNLYVLLRGRKRFLLFSPADAFAMSTVGDLKIGEAKAASSVARCLMLPYMHMR